MLTAIVLLSIGGCAPAKKQTLTIFQAGSLSLPFKEMSAAFQKKHPDVEVLRESSGSRTAARKINELNKKADIMGSADYTVITSLLMPKHTDFYLKFATNEMVIMYTEHSKYNDEINSENWPQILLRKGVNYGHSDPNADPCGYRSQLVWQLAEKHYKKTSLYKQLKKQCPAKNVRPKETDLLALLEAGELDYLFIYRSVAKQHHGQYVVLPDQVNLRSATYTDFYKQAKIKISGKKPGQWITKTGQPMVYGITAIKDAENYDLALKFIKFLISPEGQKIMAQNGQPSIIPAKGYGNVPKLLSEYVKRG
ncbi:tungstate ABC transporter substrate-binding protein WtpA [Candidatus Margulisiibacteriota bacterium]